MHFKLNKFKKISGDASHTVMEHEDGHQMRIEHKALSPKMRADMIAIPVAQKQSNPKLEQSKKEPPKFANGGEAKDPTQRHLTRGDKIPNQIEKGVVNKTKSEMKMAEGGPTDRDNNTKAFVQGFDPQAAAEAPRPPVEQGDSYSSSVIHHPSAPQEDSERTQKYKKAVSDFNKTTAQARGGEIKKYAEGTPDQPVTADTTPSQPAPQPTAPVVVNVSSAPPAAVPANQPIPAPEDPMGAAYAQANNQEQIKAIQPPPDAAGNAYAQAYNQANGVQPPAQPNPGPSPASVPSQAPKAAPQAAAPSGPTDPYGTQAAYDTFQQGMGNTIQGYKEEAAGKQQEAAGQQEALKGHIAALQNIRNSYAANLAGLNTEQANALKAYRDQTIDPKHYWNSKSTIGKIGSIIGLMLGGMGAGSSGGENPATEMLNKQIDRDIAAQQAELGKRSNLLEYNLKQYKNLNDATDMTRVMQTDIVINDLKLAQAKAATPMAKAILDQQIGAFQTQNSNQIGQMAMRRTLLGAANQGQISPERVIALAIPADQRKEMTDELGEARKTVAAKDNVLSAFDQLTGINTIGNRITSPIQTPSKIEALRSVIAGLSKETAGRFTEQDAHILEGMLPKMGDDAKTLSTKRAQLVKTLSEKMKFPALDGYGLGAPVVNSGRYTPEGVDKTTQLNLMPHKAR